MSEVSYLKILKINFVLDIHFGQLIEVMGCSHTSAVG